MGQNNMNPRTERKLSRISGKRIVKETFLIICEGVNTEPDYFNAFRLTSATVKAVGHGMGTTALVQKAVKIRKQKGVTFDHYWVVFDKDDFSDTDFNAAIVLAKQNGFEVAYSNQAFEYWFLLHFNLYQGALHRMKYEKMLSDLLGFSYSKKMGVSNKIFNVLLGKQQQAISNAKTVMKQFDSKNPAQEESSTTVYQLVEELIKYL